MYCGEERTVDGEVDPRAVDASLVSTFQTDDRALVPAFVLRSQVADLDRRHLDEPDAALVALVDVRRVAVELDEDGHLMALLAPRHDVIRPGAAAAAVRRGVQTAADTAGRRAKHIASHLRRVALEQLTAADVRRQLNGATLKPSCRCNTISHTNSLLDHQMSTDHLTGPGKTTDSVCVCVLARLYNRGITSPNTPNDR